MTNIFTLKNVISILICALLTYIIIYMMFPEIFLLINKKEYFKNNKDEELIK